MSESRKYTDKQYVDYQYFEDDDISKVLEQKLVTTRKEHLCLTNFAQHTIPVGSRAILEKAIYSGAGRVSNYICLDCADKYLDQVPN